MDVRSKKIDGVTVFNKNKTDTLKQPMFFGKPLGVQRYDGAKFLSLINLQHNS